MAIPGGNNGKSTSCASYAESKVGKKWRYREKLPVSGCENTSEIAVGGNEFKFTVAVMEVKTLAQKGCRAIRARIQWLPGAI
jgi:hypothetical protein